MKQDITPAEQAIMNVLWESKHWITINELIEYFEHLGKEWKRQTVNTYLTRLIEKGLVVKNGRKYIYAYGSLKKFVAALSDSHSLKSEDIKELKEYLDQL